MFLNQFLMKFANASLCLQNCVLYLLIQYFKAAGLNGGHKFLLVTLEIRNDELEKLAKCGSALKRKA